MCSVDDTAPGGRAPFADYLARMQAVGFRPSRSRGQNFLLDPQTHRAICRDAGVGAGDLVLEIGAGLGFLTRELCAAGASVVAVEVDTRLCTLLRQDLETGQVPADRVTLVEGSALGEGGLSPAVRAELAAAPRLTGRRLVVANLPYALAGPLIAGVLGDLQPLPDALALLVQRELAERLLAPPAAPDRGALGVAFQSAYSGSVTRRVPAASFRPRPRVESAVVVGQLLPDSPLASEPPPWRRGFFRFVRSLFGGRRRKIRHNLARAVAAGIAETRPDVDPAGAMAALADSPLLDRRPVEVATGEFLVLWRQACSAAPREGRKP